jgi:hypothetical protein
MTITKTALSKAVTGALMGAALTTAVPANAIKIGDTEWTGYVRQHIGWALDADFKDNNGFQDLASKDFDGKINMMRTTFLLQGTGSIGDVARWTIIGRTSYEDRTDYLQDLTHATADPAVFFGAIGGSIDYRDQYEEDSQLRELYVDFSTGRVDWRIGKQQVVWGETDVFHPSDVIHGYDNSWHFLEPENEELRKPLWLLNATIDFTEEADGTLQLIFRPGWDSEDAVGTTWDYQGGRWGQNGARGADFLGYAPIDYDYKGHEYDDENYGFRWEGSFGEDGDLSYSFSYYRGVALDNVLVGVTNSSSLVFDPMGGAPLDANDTPMDQGRYDNNVSNSVKFGASNYGDVFLHDVFVYQMIETYAATLSGYIAAVDGVYRLEVSHVPNRWYGDLNADVSRDHFGTLNGEVSKHDTTTLTVGFDTNARLMNTFMQTNSPSLVSLQLFNTHIHNYDQDNFVGEGARDGSEGQALKSGSGGILGEDTLIGTIKVTFPYQNDTLVWDFTALADFSDGGYIYLPSVEKAIGKHWRLRAQLNMFSGGNKGDAFRNASWGSITGDNGMSLVGQMENNDTLIARITYQF